MTDLINIGTNPNDGTGDPIRDAFDKINKRLVRLTTETGSAELPRGTELERDASPSPGYFRFNTESKAFEGWTGTEWITLTTLTITEFITSTTGSIKTPSGTIADRDVTPEPGYFRFNTETVAFEGYDGTEWKGIGSGGGSINDIFYENGQLVDENYTISSDRNAMTAGPVTVDDGITVTIEDGATWIVL